MKRISIIIFFICTACFTLSGCAYFCTCNEDFNESREIPVSRSIPKGVQLTNECAYINESIADSKAFAEKMSKSRYAIHYHAMSRERVSALQKRAKVIGCI